MWLWYSWQSAAVVNENGDFLDIEVNDGNFSVQGAKERLQLVAKGQLPPEAKLLLERFPEAKPTPHGSENLPDANYPLPTDEQQMSADTAALSIAEEGVAMSAGDPDRRLEHLLRASDELRTLHLTMEARLVEWIGLFLPSARFEGDRSGLAKSMVELASLSELATLLDVEPAYDDPSSSEWNALHDWGCMVANQRRQLDRLEHAIRESTESHLPSVSALV